jgi:hypothetical protein
MAWQRNRISWRGVFGGENSNVETIGGIIYVTNGGGG